MLTFTPTVNLEAAVILIYMSLDWGRKTEHLEETHTQDQEEEDGKLHSGRTQLTISFKQETVVSLSRFFQSLSIIWENEENTITQ